jgi:hypothetical protein
MADKQMIELAAPGGPTHVTLLGQPCCVNCDRVIFAAVADRVWVHRHSGKRECQR